jgi:hypothetical protein
VILRLGDIDEGSIDALATYLEPLVSEQCAVSCAKGERVCSADFRGGCPNHGGDGSIEHDGDFLIFRPIHDIPNDE